MIRRQLQTSQLGVDVVPWDTQGHQVLGLARDNEKENLSTNYKNYIKKEKRKEKRKITINYLTITEV